MPQHKATNDKLNLTAFCSIQTQILKRFAANAAYRARFLQPVCLLALEIWSKGQEESRWPHSGHIKYFLSHTQHNDRSLKCFGVGLLGRWPSKFEGEIQFCAALRTARRPYQNVLWPGDRYLNKHWSNSSRRLRGAVVQCACLRP